mgnify:CR=1 FL=1
MGPKGGIGIRGLAKEKPPNTLWVGELWCVVLGSLVSVIHALFQLDILLIAEAGSDRGRYTEPFGPWIGVFLHCGQVVGLNQQHASTKMRVDLTRQHLEAGIFIHRLSTFDVIHDCLRVFHVGGIGGAPMDHEACHLGICKGSPSSSKSDVPDVVSDPFTDLPARWVVIFRSHQSRCHVAPAAAPAAARGSSECRRSWFRRNCYECSPLLQV